MKRASTKRASAKTSSVKRLAVSRETKRAYNKRDRALDRDPDAPQMPPEYWANAAIGKYYRPLKSQISFRIDNEVLDWLKSKGEGHLTRINEVLRERMVRDREREMAGAEEAGRRNIRGGSAGRRQSA